MFGYLTAATGFLEEEQYLRYRACYCGLCRSLKQRHGQFSRLTLNYDLTFLVLLLSSLYEPEEERGENGCIIHPLSRRQWAASQYSSYAADINLALAYMKMRDDWDDDCDPVSLAASHMLRPAFRRVSALHPRQCAAIREGIDALTRLEQQPESSADQCAACFGRLMSEIFAPQDDRWASDLKGMGDALGRFIYIMDACMDLEKDARLCRFNPFLSRLGMNDNGQYFGDILKMHLADCIYHFERLPLVQDADIMRNILCLGLWASFNKKFLIEKGPSDVSGPI